MRKAYLLATTLVLLSTGVTAADQVPVIELQIDNSASTAPNYSRSATGANNGEMLMLLQDLQQEVRSLRGMVEKQQYQIRQMEQQQRDRYRDLDRRISSQQAVTSTTQTGETSVPAQTAGQSTAVQTPLPAADSTPTDTQAYQQAFALVRQKNYPEALKAFDSFVELYPDSVRLPNAWYWIGEVNLAEQQLEMAQAAFSHVLKNFPDHRKAADASYKLGVIYHQMGDQTQADKLFKDTISRFPDSTAAGLARDYLKR